MNLDNAQTLPVVAARSVTIPAGEVTLEGDLIVPESARGVVLFAHGSGSSRFSPRNRFVANHLVDHGFATLLMDLLTEDEERIDDVTRHMRFDIPFLAERLSHAIDWLTRDRTTRDLPIGLFGASTGAAAALISAVQRTGDVKAIVSRGGRPDLAGTWLPMVTAPVLLIVGGNDDVVIQLNRQASDMLRSAKQLAIVSGATHLFEEPGTLEKVAALAAGWFLQHLADTSGSD